MAQNNKQVSMHAGGPSNISRIIHQESSQDASSSSREIPGGIADHKKSGSRSALEAQLADGGRWSEVSESQQVEEKSTSTLPSADGSQQQQQRRSVRQFSSTSMSSSCSGTTTTDGTSAQKQLQKASSDFFEQQQRQMEQQEQQMLQRQRQLLSQQQQELEMHQHQLEKELASVGAGCGGVRQQTVQQTSVKSQQTVQRQSSQQTLIKSHGFDNQPIMDKTDHKLGGRGVSAPVFERSFENARFLQGGDAQFEGKITGNPTPKVTWSRHGRPLLDSQKYMTKHVPTTGVVTLTVRALGAGDEGEYTCTATNQYGEAVCAVHLQPEASFKRQQMQPINRGNISHQIRSSGLVTSRQQDFKVDTFEYRLINESEFRESITHYKENKMATSKSRVHSGSAIAPRMQSKPRAAKAPEGSDATFQARIDGTPEPHITWFFNGKRIVANNRVVLGQTGQMVTLTLREVHTEDTGYYTMLAENNAGCVVSSAYLAVEAPPSPPIEQQHQFPPSHAHQTISHAQTAISHSRKVLSHASHRDESINTNVMKQDFQQENKSLDQSGKTEVDARRAQVPDTNEQQSSLKPHFLKVPDDIEVQEGKLVRLECKVSGKPAPEVYWLLNGENIQNDANHKLLVNEAGIHSLLITNAFLSDAGSVTCVAVNSAGQTQHQMSLSVLEAEQLMAPKFVQRFRACSVQLGEAVSLSCRAVGSPSPQLSWQKDGHALVANDTVAIMTEGGSSLLDIPNARAEHSGWYQCTAQNSAGYTATRAKVHVQDDSATSFADHMQFSEPKRLNLAKPTKVIEPEEPSVAELVHLRHVERSSVRQHRELEERPPEPPRFTSQLQDAEIREGDRILVQAHLTPISDASMQIEWFVNGRPLPASSRTNQTYKFGYVSLSLLSSVEEDTGHYICRASNRAGVDETSCQILVKPRQDPASYQHQQRNELMTQISRLEQPPPSKDQRPAEASAPPVFVRHLREQVEVDEESSVRFDAQLEPANDGQMVVEWYKDQLPLTAGSRITWSVNFGFVSLTISQVRTDDAGIYTARAVNKSGEALSSGKLLVRPRTDGAALDHPGVTGQQEFMESVQRLETHRQIVQSKHDEHEETFTAPVFIQPLSEIPVVAEGRTAHLEGRIEPAGDSSLQVQWLKDGRPLDAGSRISSFFNFGYVSLTIRQAIVQDSGEYTCLIKNRVGQDSSSVRVQCKLLTERSGGTDGSAIAMHQFQHLEDTRRYQKKTQDEMQVVRKPPKFLGPIKGSNTVKENQTAHFEVRLEPQNDTTMQIQWFLNGQPLPSASRVQTYHNFGYVAVDIGAALPSDSGTITVTATNSLGQAQQQTQLNVQAQTLVDSSTIHEGVVEKTERLERSKRPGSRDVGDHPEAKPVFTTQLKPMPPLKEGSNVHLECRLEPANDPAMTVEWFLNGQSITIGSRLRTYWDFGVVALDLAGVRLEDAGHYTVRAVNRVGIAEQSVLVQVASSEKSSYEHQTTDHYLEESQYGTHVETETSINMAPVFTKVLTNIEAREGSNIHLECRLRPIGDSSMTIGWFVNDQPIKIGHRYRPAHDFDYVALDLLGVYPSDSGMYTCKAVSQHGQALSSASVRVLPLRELYTEDSATLQQLRCLEDRSRLHRADWTEEVATVKPSFVTQLKHQENLKEGCTAHLEARLEPITDSSLNVVWLKDGSPITIGHRHRPIHDFGYVALDISDFIDTDSGIYTCRAENSQGVDESSAILSIAENLDMSMEATDGQVDMAKFRPLENRSQYRVGGAEEVPSSPSQAPIFTTSLNSVTVREGQRAHLQCRLIPVSDTTMKIQWLHDGFPLKTGSRFSERSSFGLVALDILQTTTEDQGTYTCKASNALGEAVTQASLTCIAESSEGTLHEKTLAKLQHLENKNVRSPAPQDHMISQTPVFTHPLKDCQVVEGQTLHFEATLIPVSDPHLQVEWLKNGTPIQSASRVTNVHDFGFVSLDISQCQEEDTATYTCRASNLLGNAVTTASATVKFAEKLDQTHSSTMEKFYSLESDKSRRTEVVESTIVEAPRFITELSGTQRLKEGQSAHLEARIGPIHDGTLSVEWLHNGTHITTGHRFRTVCEFGLISLDIVTVYPEDSGKYEARVTNASGSVSSSVSIQVEGRASLIQESHNPSALHKLSSLENKSYQQVSTGSEQGPLGPPAFGRPLRNATLTEGQLCHLEATVSPVNDPTMKVEWFNNGVPLQHGHRFKTVFDFGYVALDLLYAYPEDSGTYMCRVTNSSGEAVSTCDVQVLSDQSLCTDTMDSTRLEKLRQLEMERPYRVEEAPQAIQKPVFITPLTNLENVREGERVHLECRLEPVNDPKLKVSWLVNGKHVQTGHRFHTTHDFGYVALDLLYSHAEDAGTYMCQAVNEVGEAINTCNVSIEAQRPIYADSQNRQLLQKIHDLEQRKPDRPDEIDAPLQKPHFTSELQGVPQLRQHGTARMEGRVVPAHDPDIRVEWMHNGKPLQSASRFRSTFDFGYVALNIQNLVPEDSGVYTCCAINKVGLAESSFTIQVSGEESVISSTQYPQGLEAIRNMENKESIVMKEETVSFQKPMFTQPLKNVGMVQEQGSFRMDARLVPVGDPNLRVEWYRNEVPLELGSRMKMFHEFGDVFLSVEGVRAEDEGVYMCRAVNQLGEAVTTASVSVQSEEIIVKSSQHPSSISKLEALEKKPEAGRVEEQKHFDKPVFTEPLTLLQSADELTEGLQATFVARCIPIGDPNLIFEWFHNGEKLGTGSRIKQCHDFGEVTLCITGLTWADRGMYMCQATNLAGQDVTTSSLHVEDTERILKQSIQPTSWCRIQEDEEKRLSSVERPHQEPLSTPPMFIKHLEDHVVRSEQQTVLLEATVKPTNDNQMILEWSKNGEPLMTGSRVMSTLDFGQIKLTILDLRPDDSGIYTCRVANNMGEAVSTSNLKVNVESSLQSDSLHPAALSAIEQLEAPIPDRIPLAETEYQAPVFTSPLNDVDCSENELVCFSCTLQPANDPNMKIEWFWNGEPLKNANRYTASCDFGRVGLSISGVQESDSGLLMCRATNLKGTAQTTGVFKVKNTAAIYRETVHPAGEKGIASVQHVDQLTSDKHAVKTESETQISFPPPWFPVQLPPEIQLGETEPLHLQCSLEPKSDPNLVVDWFFNSQPLIHANRFGMLHEFGTVQLDLDGVYPRDQGVYTCRARNQAGEAFTSITLTCSGQSNLVLGTQHPKGVSGLDAIQLVEESRIRSAPVPGSEPAFGPPVFTTQFANLTNLSEGRSAHFEANLTPVGDPTMTVQWMYNGKPLEASNRVRTVNAFGVVILEIDDARIADSGIYTCQATNQSGQSEISVELQCVESKGGMPPQFTTEIQDISGVVDGQSAHFSCTLTPVSDSTLRVEWLHNGQPLQPSSRSKAVCDFGFAVLELAHVQATRDAGEYVCRAENAWGHAETRATLSFSDETVDGVERHPQQPQSISAVENIEQLMLQKQKEAGYRQVLERSEEVPPKFTEQLGSVVQILEGQSVHLQARLIPINDPYLKVEWFHNGKKLPTGHRFRTFHDFGIVVLDILYCYESDSGEYECRAVNRLGSDRTSTTITCSSKSNLILTPQIPKEMSGGLEKIQNIEDSTSLRRSDQEETIAEEAPCFIKPLQNLDGIREGENAHFEGLLKPKDDPNLKTEWYHNGRLLKASSRYRTFCEFGFVILEISPVFPEDSGTFTCRAENRIGEATTSATLHCTGKQGLVLESQLASNRESTMAKIADLEGLQLHQPPPEQVEEGSPPKFVSEPEDQTLSEGQQARFECRIAPASDPTLRIDWFHNGRPLCNGSRIRTINDFGFVILEMNGIMRRDAGVYTCKAVNKHGEAAVTCQLSVKTHRDIVLEPQSSRCLDQIRSLEEKLDRQSSSEMGPEQQQQQQQRQPPRFVTEIQALENVEEGESACFECRVEPVTDPSMRIEWFFNNKYLTTGSRVHTSDDFGFVVLELDWTMPRDSGEYVCRATNKWGTATTRAQLRCKGKRNVDSSSQLLSSVAQERLKELERGGPSESTSIPSNTEGGPPVFVKETEDVAAMEGETCIFQCSVEPKSDPGLRVEWYHNEKLLQAGHRFRTSFEFGSAQLQIIGLYSDDSGQYTCRAFNHHGEAFTSSHLSCRELSSVVMTSSATTLLKKSECVEQMERTLKKYTSAQIQLTADDIFDSECRQPPRFVTQMESLTELEEMNGGKFECQLAPVGDPNMKVEWFFNGRPLPYKNRFTPIYDFGYVAMEFDWLYPEDSGEYFCRATNLYGSDETKAIIKTKGKPGIVYESQLPAGMRSVEQIQQLETKQLTSCHASDQLVTAGEQPVQPPVFVTQPESVTVTEGDWVRFCCRVTGYPRPRLLWLINGNSIVNGTRYKLSYDGMWRLDIPRSRQYDSGQLQVLARNTAGQTSCSCSITVKSRGDDYRSVLKNAPKPWYDQTQQQQQHQETSQDGVLWSDKLKTSGAHMNGTKTLQKKTAARQETEWQRQVKGRQDRDHYTAYRQLEENQLLKETKTRESARQFAVPGDAVSEDSTTKGMAAAYLQSLSETTTASFEAENKSSTMKTSSLQAESANETHIKSAADQRKHQQSAQHVSFQTAESAVHGKEVHTSVQRQQQKEVRGDVHIQRRITSTETQEVQHSAQTQERVVQGHVEPCRPPAFTKKLQPCRAVENGPARFEVEYEGDPAPKIEWFREDFNIKSSSDFKISTDQHRSVLMIREVFLEDSGEFSCVAENRGGRARSCANLLVEPKRSRSGAGAAPSFSRTAADVQVSAGRQAILSCQLSSDSQPADVYWLKDGQRVSSDHKHRVQRDGDQFSLILSAVSAQDVGSYECVAINKYGEARCQAEVALQAVKPSVKPKPPPAPSTKTTSKTSHASATRSKQQQQQLEQEQQQQQQQQLQQKQQEQQPATAPKISEPMKGVIVQEGGKAMFRCKFTGTPAPDIEWMKDERPLAKSKYINTSREDSICFLTISKCSKEDAGTYFCVATNSAGKSTMKAPLKVTEARHEEAPVVGALADVTCVEGEPARFSASVKGRPTPTVTWLREDTVIPRSEDFKMYVKSGDAVLEIGETYVEDSGRITCRASNSAGTSTSSAQLLVQPSEDSEQD